MAANDSSPALFRFADRYGPYAFGVASLLIIWTTIVSPQLEATKVNYEAHQRVVDQMRGVVDQMRDIVAMQRELASTLKDAIHAMERIVSRTESTHPPATDQAQKDA